MKIIIKNNAYYSGKFTYLKMLTHLVYDKDLHLATAFL